jgi:hypothetical protein
MQESDDDVTSLMISSRVLKSAAFLPGWRVPTPVVSADPWGASAAAGNIDLITKAPDTVDSAHPAAASTQSAAAESLETAEALHKPSAMDPCGLMTGGGWDTHILDDVFRESGVRGVCDFATVGLAGLCIDVGSDDEDVDQVVSPQSPDTDLAQVCGWAARVQFELEPRQVVCMNASPLEIIWFIRCALKSANWFS